MEEKTFSRGEINHMIEIMNSRSADVPKVHQECKDIILSARGAKDTIGPQNLRRPTEGKQDDSNKAVWDVATPLPKPTLDHVQDKGNGFLNGSFSPLQQLQTPIYGQLRSNLADDGHGTVRSICRIRHNGLQKPNLEDLFILIHC
ncbi:hypothetical protein V6Z12_A05G016500 [Gossypium hirsutum]|uniref:Uncharacterized protein isoform X1 n=1 Tax=Gossypium hirsutum TaxID=3635 RepID=A0ABM3BNT7_GOSHI|nr:uncharacterized protein LOC121203185 isoform X1 [Gossypium hirsutum]